MYRERLQELSLIVGLVTQAMISESLCNNFESAKERKSSTLGFMPLLNDLVWQNFTSDRLMQSNYKKKIEIRKESYEEDSVEDLMEETIFDELKGHLIRYVQNVRIIYGGEQCFPILTSQVASEGDLPSLQLLVELIDESSVDIESTWEQRSRLIESARRESRRAFNIVNGTTSRSSLSNPIRRLGNHIGLLEKREKFLTILIESALGLIYDSVKELTYALQDEEHTPQGINGKLQFHAISTPFSNATQRTMPHSQEVDRLAKRLKPVLDRMTLIDVSDGEGKDMEYIILIARHMLRLLPIDD